MAEYRMAMILCQYSDVPAPSQLNFAFFANLYGNLNDYWLDISYRTISLGPAAEQIFGWWTMKYTSTQGQTLTREDFIAEAKRLATDNNVDLSPYHGVMAILNEPPAPLPPPDGGNAGNDMSATIVNNEPTSGLTAFCHELGHCFGLVHSWSMTPEKDYGNPWDLMSAMDVYCEIGPNLPFPPEGPGLDAWALDRLGCFAPGHVWTITKTSAPSQTAQLLALNASFPPPKTPIPPPPSGYWAIKISVYEIIYYIEYRQRAGWDLAIPQEAVLINQVRPWKYCKNCLAMVSAVRPSPGPCPGAPQQGGPHDLSASSQYSLRKEAPISGETGQPLAIQTNWQWCSKCETLAQSGSGFASVCAAGGVHDFANSDNYALCVDPLGGGQSNWRQCAKCGELFYAGFATMGQCPSGGQHVIQGTNEYYLASNYPNSFLVGGANGGPQWLSGSSFTDSRCGLILSIGAFGDADAQAATITVDWWREWEGPPGGHFP
jgi:hypothetical protein